MRVLLFVCVLSFSVFAQSPTLNRTIKSGNDLANERKYEQAIETYRTAKILAETERLNGSFLAKIHFNTGVCLYQLKRPNEAVAEYTEAINLSHKYQKAFYALGMAQADLKNWHEAETAFQNALKLEKTNGEAWFDLALVRLELKNFAAARKAFENSVKFQTVNSADALNNLGVIAALNGDWNSAELKFKSALLKSNGANAEAKANLQFCKFYKQQIKGKDWLAKLEFSQSFRRGE